MELVVALNTGLVESTISYFQIAQKLQLGRDFIGMVLVHADMQVRSWVGWKDDGFALSFDTVVFKQVWGAQPGGQTQTG